VQSPQQAGRDLCKLRAAWPSQGQLPTGFEYSAAVGGIVFVVAVFRRYLSLALLPKCADGVAEPVFMLLFGLGSPLIFVLLSSVCMGVALDVFYVIWMTTIQQNVPEESLSRVNSYDTFGSYVFGPLGVAIAGPIAMQIGAGTTLIIGSVVSVVALLVAGLFPSVRNLEAKI
jgi:hypothetical protein